MAGNPRIYGQLVPLLSKYSKFAGAGDKAAVRQAAKELKLSKDADDEAPAADADDAEPGSTPA
jgi:myo-inositol-1(or 4)-monophosphatase